VASTSTPTTPVSSATGERIKLVNVLCRLAEVGEREGRKRNTLLKENQRGLKTTEDNIKGKAKGQISLSEMYLKHFALQAEFNTQIMSKNW
jgi:hypothetical protein